MHITTQEDLSSALNYLKTRSILGFDVETNGLDPLTNKVLLIQVGDQHKQFCFDVHKLGASIYDLLSWFKSETVLKIAHNAKFDYSMIKANFDVELDNIACTMIGSKLLSMGRNFRHSLDIVLKKFLGVMIDKGLQKSFISMRLGEEFTDEQIDYSLLDVQYLIPLYEEITKKLNNRDMGELAQMEYEVVKVAGDMELNGIFISKPRWLSLRDAAQVRLDSALLALNKIFVPICQTDLFGDPEINYGSPLQIKPALEKLLNKQIESTNATVLKALKNPITDKLLEYREASKKLSTYGEAFLEQHIHPSDNRIHSRFNQLGAATGRFAGTSPNLMNIPKDTKYRAAFTAQYPEYRIIAADFSGQNNRIF